MNTKNIGSLVFGTTVISLLSFTPASAVVLVEPIISTPNPNFPSPNFGLGDPPTDTVLVWRAPDISGQQNFLNDTGYNITMMELFLLPDLDEVEDEVIWGDVDGDGQIGSSAIFESIEIDNDFILVNPNNPNVSFRAPRVIFSEGVIPVGTRFIVQTPTDPDLTPPPEVGDDGPLLVGGRYDGVKVPEPSSLLGLISILGLGSILNLGIISKKRH
ncbi:MAG: hypothetical protein QNJ37_10285 [Crocosphaera sp.]|nr:hypothetical protein [Crocosphaera sp.]